MKQMYTLTADFNYVYLQIEDMVMISVRFIQEPAHQYNN